MSDKQTTQIASEGTKKRIKESGCKDCPKAIMGELCVLEVPVMEGFVSVSGVAARGCPSGFSA